MSILIKGFEIPTRCAECRLSTVHSFNDRPLCDVLVEYMSYGEWETKRLDNCPLVEVPEPHGRLIDADELVDKHFGKEFLSKVMTADEDDLGTALVNVPLVIKNAPTVIPAEEGE